MPREEEPAPVHLFEPFLGAMTRVRRDVTVPLQGIVHTQRFIGRSIAHVTHGAAKVLELVICEIEETFSLTGWFGAELERLRTGVLRGYFVMLMPGTLDCRDSAGKSQRAEGNSASNQKVPSRR